ncbi:Zinc knuckle [Hirschfeldia incana]|nr:Zinc knuckle [Hirschfeldia incana]
MESTRSDPELDADDDFSEIYKEYTGPVTTTTTNVQEKSKLAEVGCVQEEEEDQQELPDPNSVPTDFTSREAKVWEAKSKATERNWKKRKEEEMICKICGESGHFTQGCPSTLGANRKSQDFIERVPARDKNVRALFTEKAVERIETETGCKIKMDEKFIIVSGKDRLILRKGVDAVHKVREDGEVKASSATHRSRSRSPRRTSVGPPPPPRAAPRNPEPQRQQQHLPSHGSSSFSGRQDKFVDNRVREENRVRENQRNAPRGSPQAYGSDRARSRSTHSKSPGRPRYSGWDKPYEKQKYEVSGYRSERWEQERVMGGGGSRDVQMSHQFERPAFPHSLEELEMEYTRDVMELAKKRDKEEDEENNKHRETMRELRESYMKKLAGLRGMNAKQWEEFLQVDAQRRQEQQARQQQISGASYGSSNYRQFPYAEFDDGYSSNPPYAGNNAPMDSEGRYPPNHVKNYPSRHQDNNYGGFQRQRREDYGKNFNRY